jgi:hypothetical protein
VAYNTSAHINAEIFNISPNLFQAVCRDLLAKATVAASATQHEANKALLQAACDAVINDAQIDLGLDHRALWQAIWPRIVYCVFRTQSASDSDPSPPPFPIRFRHRFRPRSATKMACWGARTDISCCGTKGPFQVNVRLMR